MKKKETQKHPFDDSQRWIWIPGGGEQINEYVCFKRELKLSKKPNNAEIAISIDSDYQLWVNGKEIVGRQFPSMPSKRFYDRHEISSLLVSGRNSIAILGYYRGRSAFEYAKGRAGLLAQISINGKKLADKEKWLCRLAPGFKSGEIHQVTWQLGFTVEYDAREDDNWTQKSYKPSGGWVPAEELDSPTGGYWTELQERPMPQLTNGKFLHGQLVAAGEIIREIGQHDKTPWEHVAIGDIKKLGRSSAEFVMSDYKRVTIRGTNENQAIKLPAGNGDKRGAFALFDIGVESFGLLRFIVDAPEGTVLDIAHGEHLDDLGVRAFVGSRSFADRYICKKGKQEFILPFRRLGCRYIEVHATKHKSPITIEETGIIPVEYPLKPKNHGIYLSSDGLMDKILEASERSLKLNMGEHYFDCPWREQSLYAFDSRNSAVFGYYMLGEYDYPVVSFSLLGESLRNDGLLTICAPTDAKLTIPIFSLTWITAVREHLLFSGSDTLFRKYKNAALEILKAFMALKDEKTGLYKLFPEEHHWPFYEWAPGLDGKMNNAEDTKKSRIDSPHNLFLLEAMKALADLFRWSGDKQESVKWNKVAETLRKNIQRHFWDEKRQLFSSFMEKGRKWHYCGLTQALAICNQLGTSATRNKLMNSLWNTPDDFVPCTLSTLPYALKASIGANIEIQKKVIKKVSDTFGGMILSGSTTVWEVEEGAKAFADAGSMCHAWSAVPIWLVYAYMLGIRPIEPGFKKFIVQPHIAELPYAKATIHTPKGKIKAELRQHNGKYSMKVKCQAKQKPIFRQTPGLKISFNK